MPAHRRLRRLRRLHLGLASALAAAALVAAPGTPAGAAGGVLDPTFGAGGVATLTVPNAPTPLRAVVVGPDGGVVIAGNSGGDAVLGHLDAAGRPYGDLEGASLVTTDVPGSAAAFEVALQTDGRVVVAGTSDTNTGGLFALRYLRNGSLDPSFGTGGRVAEPLDPDGAFNLGALAVQPDGRILVGGFFGPFADKVHTDRPDLAASAVTVSQMVVIRLLPDGSRDTGFGDGGMVRVAFSGPAGVSGIAVQPDGRIVLGGSAVLQTRVPTAVRLLADGSLDSSFGAGGTASVTFADADAALDELVVQADGSIVGAGPVFPHLLADAAAIGVVRWRPDGQPDPAFSDDGRTMTPLAGIPTAVSIGQRRDGRIVVGAGDRTLISTRLAAYVFRADGSPDPTFGAAGAVQVQLDAFDRSSIVLGTAVQPDGRVVAVGSEIQHSAPTISIGRAWRLTTTPLDVADPQGYWMLDASGRVYAFGDTAYLGDPRPDLAATGIQAVDLAATASGNGYWVADERGGIHASGDAVRYGDVAPATGRPTVSLTRSGDGYLGVAADLSTVAWTSAGAATTIPGFTLNQPVVDAVPNPGAGGGTYAVAADGGVFALGAAPFLGSMGATPLNQPITGMATDPDGRGYWLVAADGGVFAFDAPFKGSMGGIPLNQPISDIVPWGDGYLLVGADGGIFTFGNGPFAGSLGHTPPATPIVAVAAI